MSQSKTIMSMYIRDGDILGLLCGRDESRKWNLLVQKDNLGLVTESSRTLQKSGTNGTPKSEVPRKLLMIGQFVLRQDTGLPSKCQVPNCAVDPGV